MSFEMEGLPIHTRSVWNARLIMLMFGLFGPAREGTSGLRTSLQLRGRNAPRSWGPATGVT